MNRELKSKIENKLIKYIDDNSIKLFEFEQNHTLAEGEINFYTSGSTEDFHYIVTEGNNKRIDFKIYFNTEKIIVINETKKINYKKMRFLF